VKSFGLLKLVFVTCSYSFSAPSQVLAELGQLLQRHGTRNVKDDEGKTSAFWKLDSWRVSDVGEPDFVLCP
jgi:hypothetical protein